MKNIKEEKSKKQHKKPEPLNVEARWAGLFSEPVLHIIVPELYVKDLLEITDKIIADPDAIDYSSNRAEKIYTGRQLSIPLNYNKKAVNFHNFTKQCCEAFIKRESGKEFDTAMNMWVVSQHEGDYKKDPVKDKKLLSGILYLKVPEQINIKTKPDGCLVFHGGRPYRPELLDTKETEDILPKVGDFYIFKSSLKYEIPPFKGKGEERFFTFNLLGRPK